MERGNVALGTLVLVIAAMVVVVGGAMVLLQTQTNLLNDLGRTNADARVELLNRLELSNLSADRNNNNPNDLSYLYIKGRWATGGKPIPWSDLSLVVQGEGFSRTLGFNPASDNSHAGCRTGASGAGVFSGWQIDKTALSATLSENDAVELCVRLDEVVEANAKLLIRVLPKNGTQSQIETQTPNVFDRNTLGLYP